MERLENASAIDPVALASRWRREFHGAPDDGHNLLRRLARACAISGDMACVERLLAGSIAERLDFLRSVDDSLLPRDPWQSIGSELRALGVRQLARETSPGSEWIPEADWLPYSGLLGPFSRITDIEIRRALYDRLPPDCREPPIAFCYRMSVAEPSAVGAIVDDTIRWFSEHPEHFDEPEDFEETGADDRADAVEPLSRHLAAIGDSDRLMALLNTIPDQPVSEFEARIGFESVRDKIASEALEIALAHGQTATLDALLAGSFWGVIRGYRAARSLLKISETRTRAGDSLAARNLLTRAGTEIERLPEGSWGNHPLFSASVRWSLLRDHFAGFLCLDDAEIGSKLDDLRARFPSIPDPAERFDCIAGMLVCLLWCKCAAPPPDVVPIALVRTLLPDVQRAARDCGAIGPDGRPNFPASTHGFEYGVGGSAARLLASSAGNLIDRGEPVLARSLLALVGPEHGAVVRLKLASRSVDPATISGAIDAFFDEIAALDESAQIARLLDALEVSWPDPSIAPGVLARLRRLIRAAGDARLLESTMDTLTRGGFVGDALEMSRESPDVLRRDALVALVVALAAEPSARESLPPVVDALGDELRRRPFDESSRRGASDLLDAVGPEFTWPLLALDETVQRFPVAWEFPSLLDDALAALVRAFPGSRNAIVDLFAAPPAGETTAG